jgi:hypothetical protein
MTISPDVAKVIASGDRLFADRIPLLGHWQEIASLFFYERATFFGLAQLGTDYAAGSFSSQGSLNRRELANLYSAMLRPEDFFEIKAQDDALNKRPEVRAFCQYATDLQRAVMYHKDTHFLDATVATDHDHVAFGQGVIEVCPTKDRQAIYYKNYHLRDVAWSEDERGSISEVHRSSNMMLASLVAKFGDRVPQVLRNDARLTPSKTVKVRHVVFPKDTYDYQPETGRNAPFISLMLLPEHETVLEGIGRNYRGYVIPRATRLDGTQYARSPFTGIILPDAKTQQALERILLEAGEKTVDTPMVGNLNAIRGDVAAYAGGITWADLEGDQRLDDALRPIATDRGGLPFGVDLVGRYDQIVREGFMLNKIVLPDTTGMTAYQVRKVVEQQMRSNIPIFGPIEAEYSEPLCAETFAVMRTLGAFRPDDIPQILRGESVGWSFKSPLQDLEEADLTQKLQEGMEIIGATAQFDPRVAKLANPVAIAKDMLRRKGWPEEWLNSDEAVAAAVEKDEQQKAMMEMMATAGAVAEGAGKAAPMVKAMQDAQ